MKITHPRSGTAGNGWSMVALNDDDGGCSRVRNDLWHNLRHTAANVDRLIAIMTRTFLCLGGSYLGRFHGSACGPKNIRRMRRDQMDKDKLRSLDIRQFIQRIQCKESAFTE